MKTYAEIFDKRGQQYDMAMQIHLDARRNEFETLLKYADLKEGMNVGDIPSGGSYFTRYLNFYINLVCVEFTRTFYNCQRESSIDIFCSDYNEIPITKNLDRIVSLASLHHFDNHPDFFVKMRTMLKSDGLLVIGDVKKGTAPAKFLNGFVNENSITGHEGLFIGANTIKQLESSGFEVIDAELVPVPWRFPNYLLMLNFCTLLFGLNNVYNTTLSDVLHDNIGITADANYVYLNWNLMFIKARKIST